MNWQTSKMALRASDAAALDRIASNLSALSQSNAELAFNLIAEVFAGLNRSALALKS